ncbi:MAG: hypothetical protein LBQ00_07725 [Syntrophobacterales bacterium]|nr:hypothetical protein [Syntrophobacterales bacterium]
MGRIALISMFLFTVLPLGLYGAEGPYGAGTDCCMCETRDDGLTTECSSFECRPLPVVYASLAGADKFRSVAMVLAQIKYSDSLINSVHRNPLVLKAAVLFPAAADAMLLPEGFEYRIRESPSQSSMGTGSRI